MRSISKTATVLVAIAALVVILGGAAVAVGSDHIAFAYKGFFRGFAHIKDDNGKQAIEQPTNIDQKAECVTAGGNSGIKGSCVNAGGSTTSNTGGITGIGKLPFG